MALRLVSLLALLGCAVAAAGMAVEPKEVQALQDIDDGVQPEILDESGFLETLNRGIAATDQSFNIGGVYQYDRKLLDKQVNVPSTVLMVHTEFLNYSTGGAKIHCIQVIDLIRKGNNALVTVQNGGVGNNFMSMKFKSERGGKIKYQIIVWGQ